MKHLLVIISLLLILSCNSKNDSERTELINIEILEKKPVIIIDHKEDETLFLRKIASISYPKLPVYSYEKGMDTLILESKSDVIKISSPNHYTKEVLLQTNDTLNISFQNNSIKLTGNYQIMDSIKIKNVENDKIRAQIANIRMRYFTLADLGREQFDIISNEYEKISIGSESLGYYNKELILKEPDSIKKLTDYFFKIKENILQDIQNPEKHENLNDASRKLLTQKALNDYYKNINSWLQYTDKETAIQILKNSLKDNSLDQGFKSDYSNNLLDVSTLDNKFLESNLHITLNILQQEYYTKTKTKVKTRFYSLYDHLPTYFNGELLQIAKSICIDKMMSWNEPWVEIEKRYQDYISSYGSDKYIKDFELQNQNKLSNEINDNKKLTLGTISKSSISLEKLIQKHKGKPIYVDYWASWCAPCIQNMPTSKKLEDKLGDKVEFIFISIDTDELKWESASQSLNLSAANSLITINYETSEFIKHYNVKEIPRYMIYDKNGTLYNDKAPSPQDELLYEELLSLTK